jgi:hypothetical protein
MSQKSTIPPKREESYSIVYQNFPLLFKGGRALKNSPVGYFSEGASLRIANDWRIMTGWLIKLLRQPLR